MKCFRNIFSRCGDIEFSDFVKFLCLRENVFELSQVCNEAKVGCVHYSRVENTLRLKKLHKIFICGFQNSLRRVYGANWPSAVNRCKKKTLTIDYQNFKKYTIPLQNFS